jgi:hypothetical protein
MAKQQGRKSTLPPRAPNFGILPRLKKINFANKKVLAALAERRRRANKGEPTEASELSEFDELMSEHDVNNSIRNAVQFFVAEHNNSQSPTIFRAELDRFGKALSEFLPNIPGSDSPLATALAKSWAHHHPDDVQCVICHEEIDMEQHWEASLDFDQLRTNLEALSSVVAELRRQEGGAGKDGNRAAHALIAHLAEIFRHYGGREPTRGFDGIKGKPIGDFFEFVTAVNELLPDEIQLNDVQHLIRICLQTAQGEF